MTITIFWILFITKFVIQICPKLNLQSLKQFFEILRFSKFCLYFHIFKKALGFSIFWDFEESFKNLRFLRNYQNFQVFLKFQNFDIFRSFQSFKILIFSTISHDFQEISKFAIFTTLSTAIWRKLSENCVYQQTIPSRNIAPKSSIRRAERNHVPRPN